MRRACVLLLVASVTTGVYAQDLRAGESVDGFPNWAERVLLEWINRARVDPQTELAKCGAACVDRACYTPLAPLLWSEQLNRSARFHSDELAKQGYFAHDSQCTVVRNIDQLYPTGCDGSASCSCVGGSDRCASGGCTTWDARVTLFGGLPSGEIIASGSDPNQAFDLWMYEPADSSSCGFSYANGHRWLILTSQGAVGLGVRFDSTGDFGAGGTPYKIPSAAHYPQQASSVQLWANWFDAAAPRSANAVVDGRCVSMSLQRGTPLNGAWSATVNGVGSGCHRYYFWFVDSTGAVITYPATGSLGIGCADWDASRIAASCDSTSPASSRHRAVRH